MSETPLMNDEAARSPTGEIVDQSKPPVMPTPDGTPTPEPKPTPTDGTPEPKPDALKPDAPVVPETYAEFKAPDNYTIDPKTIEAATPIFKELGLTQDQAQKLVTFHSEQLLAAAKGPQDAYAATRTDWQAKVKADPDMAKATNGDKTGLDAVKLDIGRALNAIGDAPLVAEFKQAMDITGAGDHPAFVKAMWKLASFITEGKHVLGAGPSPAGQKAPGAAKPDTAHALYPNLP